ncbi:MAG: hypothetical protein EOP11_18355 [Proteobacteria bacterium]|nr:MAG: hypothetical protein EOP11_18355 [Pseudomonadota bacterium]
MKLLSFSSLALLTFSSFAGTAFAWEPEFGTEPTVQGPEMAQMEKYEGKIPKLLGFQGVQKIVTEEAKAARARYLAILKETCKIENCVFTVVNDSHFPGPLKYLGYNAIRISYPNGFWIQVSYDVTVLEFQTPKSPLSVYEANRDLIQRDIFDAAKAAGLTPSPTGAGAGHISYDRASSFEGDRLFARNMLVDESNNTFLGEGVLGPAGANRQNAPGLGLLPASQQEAFKEILKEFDANPEMTIDQLYQAVRERVYNVTLNPHDSPMIAHKPNKYQAIALWDQRIEDRRFGPPTDADDLIAQIRLKRARLKYIREKKSPIPYRPILGDAMKNPNIWKTYLEEMKEKPAEFNRAVFGPFRAKCESLYANVSGKKKKSAKP